MDTINDALAAVIATFSRTPARDDNVLAGPDGNLIELCDSMIADGRSIDQAQKLTGRLICNVLNAKERVRRMPARTVAGVIAKLEVAAVEGGWTETGDRTSIAKRDRTDIMLAFSALQDLRRVVATGDRS